MFLYSTFHHCLALFAVFVLFISIIGCEKNKNEHTADEIYLNNKQERIPQILDEIKEVNIGSVGWRTLYSGSNHLAINGGGYLLFYEKQKDLLRIHNALSLKKFDSNYVQGDIYTNFSFNSNGDRVIINNGDSNIINKYNMYYFDLINDKMKLISYENYVNLKDAWSCNSNYYTYAENNKIVVYDIGKNIIKKIPFNCKTVNKIYISNNGDILIDAQNIYLLKECNNYSHEKINIKGDILTLSEGEILYFERGNIYRYTIDGEEEKIDTIGSSFKLYDIENSRAIFSNNEITIAYNMNTYDKYKFNIDYNKYLSNPPKFSPDLQKYLINDYGNYKVMFHNGMMQKIDDIDNLTFDRGYHWLDNNTLITIVQKSNSLNLGEFQIIKKN